MNAQRVSRLTDEMKHAGVDALFISNPKNVQYLTGFHATMPGEVQLFGDPEGFAVAFEGKIHLLCDGRYIAGASELPGVIAQRIDSPTTAKVLTDGLRAIIGDGRNVIGFEADAMLHADAVGFFENLKEMECRPAQEIVSGLRLFKSKEEVDCIRKAQEITGACFDFIAKQLRVGISEHDVAFEIDTFLRRHGEGSSFKPIVAFAETSARPHYTPDPNRKLQKGQMVLLDFGGIYQGYCGDMTRMAVMGKTDARQREVYDLVLAAQTRCLNGIKPGMACQEVDALCREYFREKNCVEAFMHGTGHGVGLAIHEPPRIKPTFQERIQPGMVFTVEPGLYFPGWGGVRIEDMVAITENGFENLTRTSKVLVELS